MTLAALTLVSVLRGAGDASCTHIGQCAQRSESFGHHWCWHAGVTEVPVLWPVAVRVTAAEPGAPGGTRGSARTRQRSAGGW